MRFTLANVFGGASSSIGKGLVPLLVVTLGFYMLPNLAIFWGLHQIAGPAFGTLRQYQGGSFLMSIGSMLVTYLLMAMNISAVYEVCVLTTAGKPVKLGSVLAHSLGNAFPILLIYLLCFLCIVLGSVFLFIPAAIFCTFYSIVVPAYVTEKKGIFTAFSRSQALTKGHRWGVFGLWIMVGFVFYALLMAIEVPVIMPMIRATVEAQRAGRTAVPPVPSFLVMAALSAVFSVVWVVILAINASVYSCLRAEKEQFSAGTVEKIFE